MISEVAVGGSVARLVLNGSDGVSSMTKKGQPDR